jgi:hypothetical protein
LLHPKYKTQQITMIPVRAINDAFILCPPLSCSPF